MNTPRRARFLAPLTVLAILAAACSSAVPSVAPTVRPTPVVTPDPHLGDPATAQEVYNGLGRAGLRITPNSASEFTTDDVPVVMRITGTYLDWPLDVFEFRSVKDLIAATKAWKADVGPGKGDPPISLSGLNILVTWGPRTTGRKPKAPDQRQAAALEKLVEALEPLLAPLRARTVVPVELAAAPAASASTVPSGKPKATPAP